MPITNADLAATFEQVADLLELQDANPFRVRAYRNAARVVGGLTLDLAVHIAQGKALPKLPGIGADLAGKIAEFATSGHLALLDRLRKELPAGVTDLLGVPGLGPKRVRTLYDELHVQNLPQLLRAARDGRVRALHGFGAKTEEHIAQAIERHLAQSRRFKLAVAAQYAQHLVAHVTHAPGVQRVLAAGSLRRCRDTVGDIDLLATVADPRDSSAACRHLAAYPDVAQVLQQGDTRASVALTSGLQVDLRVVPAASFGAALLYFTGSKSHNIRLRRLAIERGLKLNEYGLFDGRRALAGATEESIYATLGLAFVPPELREDRGEIEAARRGTLPHLVERADLCGDLHAHTNWSDGSASLEEMARAAAANGLQYLAISEHSRRLTMAHGLDPPRLLQQCAQIEEFNASGAGAHLLTGIEVDILDDGTLDLPDSALAPLDVVIAAVHSKFDLSRARQTARVLAALDNPHVRLLAHPLGRLIGRREPYDLDMLAVIRKCRARGIALELNAHPERLDLTDVHCRMARDEGVPVAIDADAHSVHDLDNLVHGIGQARRGWLEKADVLNTRPLDSLLRWLKRKETR
jgi:DNA polymerase (family 10)